MEAERKRSYPRMPVKQWWGLRNRFVRSIPKLVDKAYIVSALEIKELSAKTNILPPLRTCGIIDDESKPTQRATAWRDDSSYPKVCEEIKKEVYPSELLEKFPSADSDRDRVKRWFARNTGKGESAVNSMSAFYLMLCKANPSEAEQASRPQKAAKKEKPSAGKTHRKKSEVVIEGGSEEPSYTDKLSQAPAIHIDLQIHISPDADLKQIDQIFASMAKHFKDFYGRPILK